MLGVTEADNVTQVGCQQTLFVSFYKTLPRRKIWDVVQNVNNDISQYLNHLEKKWRHPRTTNLSLKKKKKCQCNPLHVFVSAISVSHPSPYCVPRNTSILFWNVLAFFFLFLLFHSAFAGGFFLLPLCFIQLMLCFVCFFNVLLQSI